MLSALCIVHGLSKPLVRHDRWSPIRLFDLCLFIIASLTIWRTRPTPITPPRDTVLVSALTACISSTILDIFKSHGRQRPKASPLRLHNDFETGGLLVLLLPNHPFLDASPRRSAGQDDQNPQGTSVHHQPKDETSAKHSLIVPRCCCRFLRPDQHPIPTATICYGIVNDRATPYHHHSILTHSRALRPHTFIAHLRSLVPTVPLTPKQHETLLGIRTVVSACDVCA
jgi:hypothetical protein